MGRICKDENWLKYSDMLGLSMAILRLNWDGKKPEGDGYVLIESKYAIFKFTKSLQVF